ncbi:hypothetical protein DRQ07_09960 [candidate division KSB1 bacterium]|nr:MAG: hypothetical protein DRQ07_09960 [candidate division KSB1 bacterium]
MRITIADIAKKANVSKMTVSRVINGRGYVAPKTAEKIKKIIDELGYQPNLIARSLVSKSTKIIGVIIPKVEHLFLDNYIAQILSGITDEALKKDYRIILIPVEYSDKSEDKYIKIVKNRLLDGMILLKTIIDDPGIAPLSETQFPFVLVNHKRYSKKINFVDSKNIRGAELAVEHLYSKGYRKIACIAGSLHETNGKDRLRGYLKKLEDLGLEKRDEWIVFGEFRKSVAYHECEKLFKAKILPDAVFCADDYSAIALIEKIKERKLRVPEDIGVVGFDDIELAEYVKPSLTTIRQPLIELGISAAKILFDLIEETRKPPIHKLLNVELIQREST